MQGAQGVADGAFRKARVPGEGAECGEGVPADYWQELQLGTKIAQEVQAGRWPVVASLLRLGAVKSWAQVGKAVDLFES